MSYKKRAKGSWNSGKAHKEESNRSERQYSKDEIRDELEKLEQGEEYRTKGKSKKKPNKLQRLKNKLFKDEKYLRIFTQGSRRSNDWIQPTIDRLKHDIKKTKEKIKEIEENP